MWHRYHLLLCTSIMFWLMGALSAGEDVSTERTYFNWEASKASFDREVYGQAYGKSGSKIFSIGGKSESGSWSDEIKVIDIKDELNVSDKVGKLSEPLAFSASASHAGKVYLLGGLGPNGLSNKVRSLEWLDGKIVEKELPPLPEPVMMAGAAVHRSTTEYYLTILGGVTSRSGFQSSSKVYELKLDDSAPKWSVVPDMPFGARVLPLVTETYNEIVVIGGYELNADGALSPKDTVWGYARVARDGHAKPGWEVRANAPYPIAHAAFSKTGQSHLVVIGGDRLGGAIGDVLNGTKKTDATTEVWSFHDPFSVWHHIGDTSEEAVGGFLVSSVGDEYLWLGAKSGDGSHINSSKLVFLASTKTMSMIDWFVVLLYFVIVATIGYYFSKKQTGSASFAIGGGETKWWATALSLMASGVSTISFMALPALAACVGLANKGPMVFMFIGMWVSAHITFPILRRLNITSTFEYVEKRFGVSLRLVGSFVNIVTQLMGRIGIVVMLPALAISTMVGIDPWISILAMGIITTLYSAVGGFEAVIWTDVVQGLLLIGGFMFIGILAIMRIDGGMGTLMAYGEELNRLNLFLTELDVTIGNMWFAILGMVLQTLQFAADQVTAQRVLATPLKDVRKMAYMSGFFSIFTAVLSAFVGLALFGFFKDNPEMLNPVMKNDQLVPIFIVNEVPVGLAGLILAALFAAAMSTVSSSVNVCGVLIGEDFYKRLFKNTTDKSEMRVMQVVTVISGLIGTGVALWLVSMDMPTLWESFLRIMSYVSGGFGAVFILGMFTRRTHEYGAIFGVVAGYGMALYLNESNLNVHYSALGVIIVTASVVAGYVFSLVVPCERKPLAGLTIFDQVEDKVTDAELLSKS